jgi:hypothetical protein
VAEPRDFPRRVFIEDVRRDGTFLRVTWHSDRSAFVISHWQRDVCVAATRVAAQDVAELSALLANGLADALATAQAQPPSSPSGPGGWGSSWRRFWRRLQRPRTYAEVLEFPDQSSPSARESLRWKRNEG